MKPNRPMRFQNAWTFSNVRRKAAEVKASRTIRHELKQNFHQLYKEEIKKAKSEERSVKSKKELFSELLLRQTKERMGRMLLAIETNNSINETRENEFEYSCKKKKKSPIDL